MAMARDGLLPQYFARVHRRFRTPYITTIWTGVAVGGVAMLTDIGSLADLTNIGTLVCLHSRLSWCDYFASQRRRPSPAISSSDGSIVPASRCLFLLRVDAKSAARDMGTLCCMACHRVVHLFPLRPAPQQTPSRSRRRANRRHPSAADQDVDRVERL